MKPSALLLCLCIGLFSFPDSLMAQVKTIPWEALRTPDNSTTIKEHQRTKRLKLSPEAQASKVQSTFSFDTPKYGLNFSIPSYGAICLGNCLENHQLIRVTAFDEKGRFVPPNFTFIQTISAAFEPINEHTLRVNIAARHEINVSFIGAVQKVIIETSSERSNPDFRPFLEMSELHYIEDQQLIANPPLAIDCRERHMIFALDHSASMEASEIQAMRAGLRDLFKSWRRLSLDIYISVIEFGGNAQLVLGKVKLDAVSLSENGAIGQYLQGSIPDKKMTSGAWTNWEGALARSQAQIEPTMSNALFFLSDGLPNSNGKGVQLATATLKNIIALANEIKSQNTRIFGV